MQEENATLPKMMATLTEIKQRIGKSNVSEELLAAKEWVDHATVLAISRWFLVFLHLTLREGIG